jgi:hypothetical protein
MSTGLKSKTLTANGQRYTINQIPGGLAHDYHSRIVGHLSAGLSKLTGLQAQALLAGRDAAIAAIGDMEVATVASALGALAGRLPPEENRFLRELFLSTATVDAGKGPVPFLQALDQGLVKGGPLTVDWLIAHAIDLGVLPFTDLAGSAPPTPPPVEDLTA